jgi:hypothetical protein
MLRPRACRTSIAPLCAAGAGHSLSVMGDVIVLFNTSRPQRLVELSNEAHIASRTLAESSQTLMAGKDRLRPDGGITQEWPSNGLA